MSRVSPLLVAAVIALSLGVAGCGQAGTTEGPEAKKVDFPVKGRSITILSGFAAGGSVDLGARLLAPLLEKELGTPVEVVIKLGAGSQVSLTELTGSKPDGYTIAATPLPTTITIYLDPERKATFARKDFQPVALHSVDPGMVVVRADSPYKTMKELVDAAKASPEKIKGGVVGVLSGTHLIALQIEKVAGVKFASVHFDGTAAALPALLGGHVDVHFGWAGELVPQTKAGQVRILGILDKTENRFAPGVKTLEAQGYPVYVHTSRGFSVPAGTPREIVDVLSKAVAKVMDTDQHRAKMEEIGQTQHFMDPDQFANYWTEVESWVRPIMEAGKK